MNVNTVLNYCYTTKSVFLLFFIPNVLEGICDVFVHVYKESEITGNF